MPAPRKRRDGNGHPDRGDDFDAWFPRIQRVVVLTVGTGGTLYAMVAHDLGLVGTFVGLLLWQGYQELRRAGNGNGG